MENRFLKFLEEIASTDWEYGDGTTMAGDARKHLDEFYRIAELEQKLADEQKAAGYWMEQSCKDHNRAEKLEQQLSRYQSKYYNLLAVAHRDGGQYLAQHGEEKAGEDAITAILTAYHNNNRYQGGVEVVTEVRSVSYRDSGIPIKSYMESPKFNQFIGQRVRALVLPEERIVDANKTMEVE